MIDPESYARNKILLGLNFYGFDYVADGGAHILGIYQASVVKSKVMENK